MPSRIPTQKIIVQRGGKNVSPPIGEKFEFTAEELEDINKVNPDAVRKVVVDGETKEERVARQEREAAAEKQAKIEAAAEKKKLEDAAKAAGKTTGKKTTPPAGGDANKPASETPPVGGDAAKTGTNDASEL